MKNLTAFIILISLSLPLLAQSGSVTVQLNEIKEKYIGQGTLTFLLFSSADGFPAEPEKAAFKFSTADFGTSKRHTFENVPYGNYAVSVYLDKNNNGTVDRNMIGIPKEPVGASNLTRMGKPTYKKCMLILDTPSKKVQIKFING